MTKNYIESNVIEYKDIKEIHGFNCVVRGETSNSTIPTCNSGSPPVIHTPSSMLLRFLKNCNTSSSDSFSITSSRPTTREKL